MGEYLLSSNYLTPRSASTLDILPVPIKRQSMAMARFYRLQIQRPDILPSSSSGGKVSTNHGCDADGASSMPRMSFFAWAIQHCSWLDYMTKKPGLLEALRSRLNV